MLILLDGAADVEWPAKPGVGISNDGEVSILRGNLGGLGELVGCHDREIGLPHDRTRGAAAGEVEEVEIEGGGDLG
jgi:hypothetical protein